jgi:hypothetical protein
MTGGDRAYLADSNPRASLAFALPVGAHSAVIIFPIEEVKSAQCVVRRAFKVEKEILTPSVDREPINCRASGPFRQ